VDVYRALADPTRRLILDELAERNDQTLFELCTRLITKHSVDSSRQETAPLDEIVERWKPTREDKP
jgi:hypothetical protein